MTVLGGVYLSPISASSSVAVPSHSRLLSINTNTFRRKECFSVSIGLPLLGISPSISATSLSPFVISFKAVTSFLICGGKCDVALAQIFIVTSFLCHTGALGVLPEHRFCIPAPDSHRSVALLVSSQNHIPFRRSFSCNRLILGNKKAGTFDVPTYPQKGRIIPLILVCKFIKCNRLCNSKSSSALFPAPANRTKSETEQ